MKLAFICFALFIVSSANSLVSFSQNRPDEPFIAGSEGSGEETVRELQIIASEAVDTGERLFVITRPGRLEKSGRINSRRLAYTKAFLLEMKRFPLQSPVFAEGERAGGEGRIEFFLGSRLRLVVLAKRDKIPKLTCCDDYFPPVKRKSRRNLKTNRPQNRRAVRRTK